MNIFQVALLESATVPIHGSSSYMTSTENAKNIETARAGALALWTLNRQNRTKLAMAQAGGIPLLTTLLTS